MKKLISQILKFGLIGAIAFVIDYSILYLLTEVIGLHFLISQVVSFSISFVFNYYFSVVWVFEAGKERNAKEKSLFLSGALIGLGINEVILYLLSHIGNVHYMISKLIATFIVMIWNFITRKYLLEKRKTN
ncbi:MAG: GtrA family protein [Tenericutes bacterium]|nr:GtrA family protein [Mycoplasmatota bacterium]